MYPNSTVELHLQSTAIPKAVMTNKTLTVELDTSVNMWAKTPNNTMAYLATLDVVSTILPLICLCKKFCTLFFSI